VLVRAAFHRGPFPDNESSGHHDDDHDRFAI
jgi:hypothetical protein